MAERLGTRIWRRFFRRWSKPATDAARLRQLVAFEELLREGSYRPVICNFPDGTAIFAPQTTPIEAVRIEWAQPHFIVLAEQGPHFNVAGLYWREP